MNDGNTKQQIVEKIKSNNNILVTVSSNPSVDELSAALGMTLLLNKMNKHATAVFSGAIPPAIAFLDPQKTFENTVDSLRDFIIALDKEKADHLRYKVDGDVVKIFITPYRTTISSNDLDFSQGDYNVELVLALGVKDRDDLDGALAAHGRILHDAAVVTVSVGEMQSELGSIDWYDANASSLSEMIVSLVDLLKGDKGLLDEQIATAFLTGIVAATDRFSNNRTSSRVMTLAAQLMSAGANQQLIASKLEEANEIGSKISTTNKDGNNSDGTTNLAEGESTKVKKQVQNNKASKKENNDGSLVITHEQEVALKDASKAENGEEKKAEENLAEQLATIGSPVPGNTPSVADLRKDLANANADVNNASQQSLRTVSALPVSAKQQPEEQPPSMGGTLNATTEQAAEDNRRAVEVDRNRTILTHNEGQYVGDQTPIFQSPLNAASQPESDPPMVDPLREVTSPPQPSRLVQSPPHEATLAELDQQNRVPHEEARAAVDAAFEAAPFTPAGNPLVGLGAQPLGEEIRHGQANSQAMQAITPPPPPLPDFSTLPPLPPLPNNMPTGAVSPEKLESIFAQPSVIGQVPSTGSVSAQSQPIDPAQFKIPGQS